MGKSILSKMKRAFKPSVIKNSLNPNQNGLSNSFNKAVIVPFQEQVVKPFEIQVIKPSENVFKNLPNEFNNRIEKPFETQVIKPSENVFINLPKEFNNRIRKPSENVFINLPKEFNNRISKPIKDIVNTIDNGFKDTFMPSPSDNSKYNNEPIIKTQDKSKDEPIDNTIIYISAGGLIVLLFLMS